VTNDISVEHVGLLSTLPAGADQRRAASSVAIVSCLVFFALVPFARTQLPRIDAFIPAYQSALIVSDLVTAMLLLGQFGVLGSRALLVLATGYLFTAFMATVHALTFPGLFTPTGLLGAGPDSTAWIYMFWHTGFPLAVIFYALLKHADPAGEGTPVDTAPPTRRRIPIVILTVAATASALTVLATVGRGLLPVIMNGNQMAPRIAYVIYPVWALSFIALAVLWASRPHSVLDTWLIAVMCAWIAEIPLSAIFNGGRFTLGYYVGRLYGLTAATFVLAVLLLEISALYARLTRAFTAVTQRTAELREAKAFLETLVTRGPSLIFKMDGMTPPIRTLYISPNIERILGYTSEEVRSVAGFWEAHIHPEDREAHRTAMATALRERRASFELQVRMQHRDGGYRWIHSVFHPEYDREGRPTSILGYDQDVTARRTAEEALKRTQEDADRANQAKSEFLSRMSHELRTPLNAILGFAQLLELGSLSAKQREGIDFILKGGHHLLELINEVLDIARIEAGRLSLSLEPVSARKVVQESLDLVGPLAAEMGIHLDVPGTTVPERNILADLQRIKQVLLNLLANAIKYNRKGGRVTLSCAEPEPGRLRIEVSDTGPGIPPDKMARLFTPFERLGAEGTSIQGTGLGLALSKHLVEAMGGTLGVESAVGKGSTFWVEFSTAESPLERVRGRDAITPVVVGARSRAATVLYVEDNLSNFKLIEELMALRPGVKLIPAMQGRMGLDLARQNHPDVILLDVHLPDISGDEVLRRLRDDPETRHIPVVVISADATPRQIDRLRAAGAREYLTKPLDVKKLLALLDELLKEYEDLPPGKTA
jgi:PAS domain S-box-containing protein